MNLNRTVFVFLALLALTIGSDYFLDNYHYRAAEHRRLQKEMDEKFKAADRIHDKLEENNWQLNTAIPGQWDYYGCLSQQQPFILVR